MFQSKFASMVCLIHTFPFSFHSSGKTSTIHYLAGSTFNETIVDGFDDLEVVDVLHPGLQNAEASSSTRSVTKSILSIDITTDSGETIQICDTPGFEDTDGVETELANGFGLVTAIHRAKRVKPVLVLSVSRDELSFVVSLFIMMCKN